LVWTGGEWRRALKRNAPIIRFYVIGIILALILRYGILPTTANLPRERGQWLTEKFLEAVIILTLLSSAAFVCVKNVPDGYVALVYWVGSNEPEIRLQGPFFIIPFIQRVELFDARAQHTELRCLCMTRDGMLIRARVRIHWAIDIGQLRSVKSLLTIEPVQSLEERITEWLAPRLGMQESAQLPTNLGQLSRDLLDHLVSNPYGAEGAGILVARAFIAGFDGPIMRRSTTRRT
jgi:hypothetical protein